MLCMYSMQANLQHSKRGKARSSVGSECVARVRGNEPSVHAANLGSINERRAAGAVFSTLSVADSGGCVCLACVCVCVCVCLCPIASSCCLGLTLSRKCC